jgi:hypothetical protein
VKNQGSMRKTNFLFSILPFNPRALLATWLHVGAFQKINLQPILNKYSPWAYTKSEFDVHGIVKKLVKYLILSSKRKN